MEDTRRQAIKGFLEGIKPNEVLDPRHKVDAQNLVCELCDEPLGIANLTKLYLLKEPLGPKQKMATLHVCNTCLIIVTQELDEDKLDKETLR